MPRYYFDIHDGDHLSPDLEGLECSTPAMMRDEAICALPGIARDRLPDGDRQDFWVEVRDDTGRHVFRASLKLTSEWLTAGT
jgi:NADPH-dependent ferric siderophore reductase